MRGISPALHNLVYPALSGPRLIERWFLRRDPATLTVLTYHGVVPKDYELLHPSIDGNLVREDIFRLHLQMLQRTFTPVAPEHVRSWIDGIGALPPRALLITCDDGQINNLDVMAPILRQENLKALFFVLPAPEDGETAMLWHEELFLSLAERPRAFIPFEGGRLEWTNEQERYQVYLRLIQQLGGKPAIDRRIFIDELNAALRIGDRIKRRVAGHAELRSRFGLLSGAQITSLIEQGMTVGSHTVSHPRLSLMDRKSALAELSESKKRLEEHTGQEMWALAYPYGDLNSVTRREQAFAADAGYRCAFINVGSGMDVFSPPDRFALSRIHVSYNLLVPQLQAHACGLHAFIQSGLTKRWGRVDK